MYYNSIFRHNAIKEMIDADIPPDLFLQEASDAIVDPEDIDSSAPLVLPLGVTQDMPLSYLLSKKLTEDSVNSAKYMVQQGKINA